MKRSMKRREFLGATAVAGAGLALGGRALASPEVLVTAEKPALLGGKPVRTKGFPAWPVFDQGDEKAWMDVLRSGKWFRGYGDRVNQFEAEYARLMGAKHCLATANGTSALLASLGALDIGPGDEVILPPYTFIATFNVILLQYALPVFVDTDPETFQIDARKVEGAVTERTAALLPVHLGGSVADLDALLAIAEKRKIPLIEDACQSHMAEWKGRKVGTFGTTGCFSFQASKNLNSGEGGAVLSQNQEIIERCYAFHNNCRGRNTAGYNFTYLSTRGANLRLTEFQAALLVAQMTRLEEQSKTRGRNAEYLTGMLKEIPGILPARMYPGCTRNAYHLYMFRFKQDQFAGLTRDKFLRALGAEGVPASSGYSPMNKDALVRKAVKSKGYQRIYPAQLLNEWEERTQCPQNDQLCKEAVWFTQTMLLGPREDMDHIAAAIRKIHAYARELAKA